MISDEEFKAKITAQIAEQSHNRALLLPDKLMDSRHSPPVKLSPEEFAAFRRQLLARFKEPTP